MAKRYRYHFKSPIKGFVSISKVDGNTVQTKQTSVAIHDFSRSGLSFSSRLDFPPQNMELLFHVQLFGKSIRLNGVIIWQRQEEDGVYHYGVRLTRLTIQFYQILERLSGMGKIKTSAR